jgi:ribosomal protein L11 methyltransferase
MRYDEPEMSDYVEVQIEGDLDSEELIGLLPDETVLGAWEDEGLLHIYWRTETWNPGALDGLRAAVSRLGPAAASADITVLTLPDRDWNLRWLESIQPVRIGKSFRVRQSWNAPDPLFEGVELVIDPKRAFGSGFHATTQLLIEWMELRTPLGARVLDMGTGSGILAMVALRLGAASALGIDNDPVAVECAKENASANGFGSELELRVVAAGDARLGKFDLVLANLDRKTLLSLPADVPGLLLPGGTALLSGLLADDCAEISAAYAGHGARVIGRRERDEWAALELQF